MVNLPWRDGNKDENETESENHPDAVVVCEFQDGTIAVYDEKVVIDRVSRSRFDDRTIPTDDITGVDHSDGITVGYLQIEQSGVQPDSGGMFSDPVNHNTVHFGRGGRDCAKQARDAILERARG